MFDNLPFLPAIEILSRGQRGHRATATTAPQIVDQLRQRVDKPDLLIVGALNPEPTVSTGAEQEYDSVMAVRRRVKTLQHDVKIRSFDLAARRIDRLLRRVIEHNPRGLSPDEQHLLEGIVNAGVLPVFPSSDQHVNGTFAFSPSTGLRRRRVRRSIGDGCYRTLRSLTEPTATDGQKPSDDLTRRSLAGLVKAQRIPVLRHVAETSGIGNECPFFERKRKRFSCPFTSTCGDTAPSSDMRDVFSTCASDAAHWTDTRAATGR